VQALRQLVQFKLLAAAAASPGGPAAAPGNPARCISLWLLAGAVVLQLARKVAQLQQQFLTHRAASSAAAVGVARAGRRQSRPG